MQGGATWTWSKTMDLVDGNNTAVNPFLDFRTRHYGKAGFDRTHNFGLNYTYDLPALSKKTEAGWTNWILDGWQISGIPSS